MNKKLSIILILLVTCSMFLFAAAAADAAQSDTHTITVKGERLYDRAYDVLALVNEERAANGLAPLVMDQDLLEAAMQRAAENTISSSHTRTNGSDCFTVISKSYSAAGENIAAGYNSAAEVMKGWMNSEGHRRNILNSSFNNIGIGAIETNGIIYWVQIFAKSNYNEISQPGNADTTETIEVLESNLHLHLNNDKIAVNKQHSEQLKINNYNNNSSYFSVGINSDEFNWSSSNTKVAEVDKNGLVTVKGNGEAEITMQLGDIILICQVNSNIEPADDNLNKDDSSPADDNLNKDDGSPADNNLNKDDGSPADNNLNKDDSSPADDNINKDDSLSADDDLNKGGTCKSFIEWLSRCICRNILCVVSSR